MTSLTTDQNRERVFWLLRALADETRFRIFVLISDSRSPLSAQQVAEALGLHPNTVRPHLERLREAGFLDLVVNADGRVGRPQHLYCVAEDAPSFGVEPGAHAEVASIMAETLTALVEQLNVTSEQAIEMGRAWGRRLERDAESAGVQASPESVLVSESARLGFSPIRGDGEVIFCECPFRDLAERYPDVVCAAHEGICEGILGTGEHHVDSVFNRRGIDERCSVLVGSGVRSHGGA